MMLSVALRERSATTCEKDLHPELLPKTASCTVAASSLQQVIAAHVNTNYLK